MNSEDELKQAVQRAAREISGKAAREVPKPEILVEGQVPKDLQRKEDPPAPDRPKPSIVAKENRRGRFAVWQDGVERNVSESWRKLFNINVKNKQPDEVLLQYMLVLFPEMRASVKTVDRVRTEYNAGRLPGMTGRPNFRSYQYRWIGGRLYQVSPRGMAVKLVETGAGRVRPNFNRPGDSFDQNSSGGAPDQRHR